MIINLTASSDTYITNKIVDEIQCTGSNVGKAGTLDLFKMYDESNISGSIEISRILLKFGIQSLQHLTSTILSPSRQQSHIIMRSISVGNPTPSDFTLSCFPLAKSFEEGQGRDVVSFSDKDESNFDYATKNEQWNIAGCGEIGDVGDDSDYYESGDFGSGVKYLGSVVNFAEGTEDAVIDVTTVVSATLCNLLDDNGFRIAYTGSQEIDSVTRFVKRFGSRHVKNKLLQPILQVKFDDSIVDDRENLRFGVTGSVYLISNEQYGQANFLNSSGSEISGQNCVILTLSTGSYSVSFTGSQEVVGGPIPGVYVAPTFISRNDSRHVFASSSIAEHINASGSITFNELWRASSDSTVLYTGNLTILADSGATSFHDNARILCRCQGPNEIDEGQIVCIKASFYDLSIEEYASKFSYEREPLKITNAFYRIRDAENDTLIYDFSEYTKLSLDSSGNYFNISSSSVPAGRPMTFEFKVGYKGSYRIINDSNFIIKVRK